MAAQPKKPGKVLSFEKARIKRRTKQLAALESESARLGEERAARLEAERTELFTLANPDDASTQREHDVAEIIHTLRFVASEKQIAKMLDIARGAKQPGQLFPAEVAGLVHTIDEWRRRPVPIEDVPLCAEMIVKGIVRRPSSLFVGVPHDTAILRTTELLARCFAGDGAATGVVADLIVDALANVEVGNWTPKNLARDGKKRMRVVVLGIVSKAANRHPSPYR